MQVKGLIKALKMPAQEFRRRADSMQKQIETGNIHNWATNFISALNLASDAPDNGTATVGLTKRQATKLRGRFESSKTQLMVLDYDHVIAPLLQAEEEETNAKMLGEIKELLRELSHASDMVIVSGQTQAVLEDKLGDLDLTFVAEHGIFERLPGVLTLT